MAFFDTDIKSYTFAGNPVSLRVFVLLTVAVYILGTNYPSETNKLGQVIRLPETDKSFKYTM